MRCGPQCALRPGVCGEPGLHGAPTVRDGPASRGNLQLMPSAVGLSVAFALVCCRATACALQVLACVHVLARPVAKAALCRCV